MKIAKKIGFLFSISLIFFIIGCFTNVVKADQGMSGGGQIGASVWVTSDEGNPNSGTQWVESNLTINNANVFCVNPTTSFANSMLHTSKDAVDYFMETGGMSRDTAQKLVTRLALYNDFFEKKVKNSEMTTAAKYFFEQAVVWNELSGWQLKRSPWVAEKHSNKRDYYPGWWSHYYWVETWRAENLQLFGNLSAAASVDRDNYELHLFSDAIKYAEERLDNYIGKGTVWIYGNHQPLIQFNGLTSNYVYYVDTACTNCNSTNKNGAYQIQDITDWNAILNSSSAKNENAKKYYKKSDAFGGVFCREEYNVVFPNANQYINGDKEKVFNVSTGRYFTVNLEVNGIQNGIANFKPIKITKTRQCKAKNASEQQLRDWFKNIGIGGFGNIELTYKEKNGGYNTTVNLIEDKNRTVGAEITYKDGVISSVQTKKYILPEGTYQYLELGTGKAFSESNKKANVSYNKLATSALPVSFDNFATNNNAVGGTIKLKYSLPTSDTNTKMHKIFELAANGNYNYFGNNSSTVNTYGKYLRNEIKSDAERIQIENSACAKLWGYSGDKNSDFGKCAKDRESSTIRICANQLNEKDNKVYQCNIHVCGEDEKVCASGTCSKDNKCEECTESNAGSLGLDWNKKTGFCCPTGTTYNPQKGTCDDGDVPATCEVIGPGKYIDANGQFTSNYLDYLKLCPGVCGVSNGKYYGSYGQPVEKEVYDIECPYGNDCPQEKKVECPENTWINGDPCERCPSGACPMPGGVCPYPGKDVIYRPIDLVNPFPGQTGSSSKNRQTGDNWCTYSLTNGTIDCRGGNSNSDGNQSVETKIKNNRGVSEYEIYSKKSPLYEVELDANTIKHIRSYNNKNTYDKWDLECTKAGICHSKFLDSEVTVGGTCSRNSNLATCARGDK